MKRHLLSAADLTRDDAELVLATAAEMRALADRPRHIRSSTRRYPYDEDPIEGLTVEDIDAALSDLAAIGVEFRPLSGPLPWQQGGTGALRRPVEHGGPDA